MTHRLVLPLLVSLVSVGCSASNSDDNAPPQVVSAAPDALTSSSACDASLYWPEHQGWPDAEHFGQPIADFGAKLEADGCRIAGNPALESESNPTGVALAACDNCGDPKLQGHEWFFALCPPSDQLTAQVHYYAHVFPIDAAEVALCPSTGGTIYNPKPLPAGAKLNDVVVIYDPLCSECLPAPLACRMPPFTRSY